MAFCHAIAPTTSIDQEKGLELYAWTLDWHLLCYWQRPKRIMQKRPERPAGSNLLLAYYICCWTTDHTKIWSRGRSTSNHMRIKTICLDSLFVCIRSFTEMISYQLLLYFIFLCILDCIRYIPKLKILYLNYF